MPKLLRSQEKSATHSETFLRKIKNCSEMRGGGSKKANYKRNFRDIF